MEPCADHEANCEHDEASETIEPEVVAGDDDAQQRRRWIQKEHGSNPPSLRERPHREHAPRRPTDVERWHRRVLIRQRRAGTLVERPRSTELGDRVDETEVLCAVVIAKFVLDACTTVAHVGAWFVEESGRHEREEDEADECESRHRGQRVAPLAEHIGPFLEQHEEDPERDEEVCRSVVRVHRLDEPRVWKEPILDGLFVIEAERTLDADHPHGIRECVQWNLDAPDERGAELVTDQGVDRVEGADDEHFFPPQGAMVARDDHRRCGRRILHVIHRIGEPALD